ncbi:flavin reductase [Robertkochia aurantiaca]|uniref:flavin reductase n=1 Tax=Robertkochia aurantiaca TaxID=2873700 RepID=UPI001CCC176E|nr:flavin reductase [Robertkochia sp. 3YJGBD-33]
METKCDTPLDLSIPVWDQTFIVAPLVVIGTREMNGYDMAPKHMVSPLGFDNFFGFVCTPDHSTYHNVIKEKCFSVSFPLPSAVAETSLTASPRSEGVSSIKPVISELQTVRAEKIDALLLQDAYLQLECAMYKIIDGFGKNSLITGTVKAARINSEYLKTSDTDEQEQLQKNGLLTYIAPGRFTIINDTYNFPYPKGFKR